MALNEKKFKRADDFHSAVIAKFFVERAKELLDNMAYTDFDRELVKEPGMFYALTYMDEWKKWAGIAIMDKYKSVFIQAGIKKLPMLPPDDEIMDSDERQKIIAENPERAEDFNNKISEVVKEIAVEHLRENLKEIFKDAEVSIDVFNLSAEPKANKNEDLNKPHIVTIPDDMVNQVASFLEHIKEHGCNTAMMSAADSKGNENTRYFYLGLKATNGNEKWRMMRISLKHWHRFAVDLLTPLENTCPPLADIATLNELNEYAKNIKDSVEKIKNTTGFNHIIWKKH